MLLDYIVYTYLCFWQDWSKRSNHMKAALLFLASFTTFYLLKDRIPALFTYKPSYVTTVTNTPTPTPTPSKTEIIAEISRVFEPEGTHIVVQAINCFYSESGLRWDAYNGSNKNGTNDGGVAQINSIHKIDDRFDYKQNIKKAHEIYKSRGNSFKAWYGPRCN